MRKFNIKLLLVIVAIFSIGILVFDLLRLTGYQEIITFPLMMIAELLRKLSLSSGTGNIFAIAIYVIVSLSPLIVLVIKKRLNKEDILLVILSSFLFFTLYFMINPWELSFFMKRDFGKIGITMLSSVTYIVFLGYLILSLLRRLSHVETKKLLNDLSLAIIITSILFTLVITLIYPMQAMNDMREIRASNSAISSFNLTDFFIILRYLVLGLPVIYGILISIKGLNLIEVLQEESYGDRLVDCARQLENTCKNAIITSTIASLIFHLLQVAFINSLIKTNFNLVLPITSIMIVLITMLLTRFFIEAKEIKEENEMFV